MSRLVGGGDGSQVTPLYVVVKGTVILKFSDVCFPSAQALDILMNCLFNLEYPGQMKNLYLMLEAT